MHWGHSLAAVVVVIPNSKDTCTQCDVSKKNSQTCRFLTTEQVMILNEGHDEQIDLLIRDLCRGVFAVVEKRSDAVADSTMARIKSSSPDDEKKNMKEKPTWWFDSDSDRGWVRYDADSMLALEDAYQTFLLNHNRYDGNNHIDDDNENSHTTADTTTGISVVLLSGGKYRVDLKSMEQINTETHFPRIIKRIPPGVVLIDDKA